MMGKDGCVLERHSCFGGQEKVTSEACAVSFTSFLLSKSIGLKAGQRLGVPP